MCVAHFWIDDKYFFQITDQYWRYSAAQIVLTTLLSEAVVVSENLWIAQFCSPKNVRGDLEFQFNVLVSFFAQYNIAFAPVPPRRNYRNLIETRHGIIRAAHLCLKDAALDSDPKLHAVSAVRISNKMFGSDSLWAYEIANCFTKPINFFFLLNATLSQLISAHGKIRAEQKVTQMLWSKASKNSALP